MFKNLIALSVLFILSCSHAQNNNQYPSYWWDEIPPEGAPSWEVLPQYAGEGEVILSKRNELGLLSNFADTPIVFDGKNYASLEGFWQAMKFPESEDDERIKEGIQWDFERSEVEQMTGFEAKRAGKNGSNNMKALNINWVTYQKKKMTYRTEKKGEHYKLIYRAMVEKLKQNPEVKKILLLTGDLVLRPDHVQKSPTPPAWKYHEIWTNIRSKIQNGEAL